ncbi:MAG: hypothetical protein IKZ19_04045 [Clostridia bacterium]|nr:hypothetical protein [Clostridia bacterium]
MKKLTALLLGVLAAAAVFSACGKTEPEASDLPETSSAEITASEASSETTSAVPTAVETTAEPQTEAPETSAAEPFVAPTPEDVWDGRDSFVITELGRLIPKPELKQIVCYSIEYSVSDAETLEAVKNSLSEDALTLTDQSGSFGRGTHNCTLGDELFPVFRMVYLGGGGEEALNLSTYIAAENGVGNTFIMSEASRAYLSSLLEEVFFSSVSAGSPDADYTGWGEKTGDTVELKLRLDSLKGYESHIVDSVSFTYIIKDRAASEVIYGCVSDGHITDGTDTILVEPNFGFTLADGRAYFGGCSLDVDGKFTVEALYSEGENGETVFFDAAARESLGELMDKFAVNSAVN